MGPTASVNIEAARARITVGSGNGYRSPRRQGRHVREQGGHARYSSGRPRGAHCDLIGERPVIEVERIRPVVVTGRMRRGAEARQAVEVGSLHQRARLVVAPDRKRNASLYAEKNPAIQKFRQQFDLDVDY